jgi:hypothetical protein
MEVAEGSIESQALMLLVFTLQILLPECQFEWLQFIVSCFSEISFY